MSVPLKFHRLILNELLAPGYSFTPAFLVRKFPHLLLTGRHEVW